jgi:hypothetical protein
VRTYGNRRRNDLNEASRSVFGTTGWLFADLMLAIAMAFLVANTVGAHAPQHKHHQVHTKEVCSPPALDRYHSVLVKLTINPIGLASNSASAQASVRQQVSKTPGLASRIAGFVIIYTGNAETSSYALTVDRYLKKVLTGPGQQHSVFDSSAYLDEQIIGGPPTQAQLDIYLFEPQQCHSERAAG